MDRAERQELLARAQRAARRGGWDRWTPDRPEGAAAPSTLVVAVALSLAAWILARILVFALVAAGVLRGSAAGALWLPFGAALLLLLAVSAWMRLRRPEAFARLERVARLAVDLRRRSGAPAGDASAWEVVLEDAAGSRASYVTHESCAARVAPPVAGYAYLVHRRLLDWKPLETLEAA